MKKLTRIHNKHKNITIDKPIYLLYWFMYSIEQVKYCAACEQTIEACETYSVPCSIEVIIVQLGTDFNGTSPDKPLMLAIGICHHMITACYIPAGQWRQNQSLMNSLFMSRRIIGEINQGEVCKHTCNRAITVGVASIQMVAMVIQLSYSEVKKMDGYSL